jgi:hypothetical protein
MKKFLPLLPFPTSEASPTSSPKQMMLTKRFLALGKDLPAPAHPAIDAALRLLPETWGRAHAHRAVSVRVLSRGAYEIRAGLALRIIFLPIGDELRCDFIGTHAEVKRDLRNRA